MDYRELAETVGPRTGATQEWVFRVLREGIISGKLKGGTQLKQDEVSAALTVSHIPVREALRQLEAQGLVTIHPNRGSTVTQLSRSTLEDMMEIRASISYYIARRAIPLLSAEDLDELQEVIEEQKAARELILPVRCISTMSSLRSMSRVILAQSSHSSSVSMHMLWVTLWAD